MQIEKPRLFTGIKMPANGSEHQYPETLYVKSFLFCLPLKFGCIISALVVTQYAVLALTECKVLLGNLAPHVRTDSFETVLSFSLAIAATIVHTVTVYFTAMMFVGTLKEEPSLLRPWIAWTSLQWFVCLWIWIYNIIVLVDADPLLPFIYKTLHIVVRFYVLVVVASFYQYLEEEKRRYEDDEQYQKLVDKCLSMIENRKFKELA